jgi:hypothetical protein
MPLPERHTRAASAFVQTFRNLDGRAVVSRATELVGYSQRRAVRLVERRHAQCLRETWRGRETRTHARRSFKQLAAPIRKFAINTSAL